MLMLTAQGTAVKLSETTEQAKKRDPDKIPYQYLDFELNKERILNSIKSGEYRIKDLEGIRNLSYYGIGDFELLVNFLIPNGVSVKNNIELIEEFMATVDPQQISNYLKKEEFLTLNLFQTKKIISLMELVEWFDFETIDYLLKKDNTEAHWKALLLLGFQKPEYSIDDIPKIINLTRQLANTFEHYPKVITKQGMFGKQKEYWQCLICGKEYELEYEFCGNPDCGANYYGMKDKSVTPRALINDWNLKAELIKKLLG